MWFIPAIGCFIWNYREVKVLKAASPKLLGLILVGAFFLYCPVSKLVSSAQFCSAIVNLDPYVHVSPFWWQPDVLLSTSPHLDVLGLSIQFFADDCDVF